MGSSNRTGGMAPDAQRAISESWMRMALKKLAVATAILLTKAFGAAAQTISVTSSMRPSQMLIKPIQGLSNNDIHWWRMATPAFHNEVLLSRSSRLQPAVLLSGHQRYLPDLPDCVSSY